MIGRYLSGSRCVWYFDRCVCMMMMVAAGIALCCAAAVPLLLFHNNNKEVKRQHSNRAESQASTSLCGEEIGVKEGE